VIEQRRDRKLHSLLSGHSQNVALGLLEPLAQYHKLSGVANVLQSLAQLVDGQASTE
jgi:hypothetical protein